MPDGRRQIPDRSAAQIPPNAQHFRQNARFDTIEFSITSKHHFSLLTTHTSTPLSTSYFHHSLLMLPFQHTHHFFLSSPGYRDTFPVMQPDESIPIHLGDILHIDEMGFVDAVKAIVCEYNLIIFQGMRYHEWFRSIHFPIKQFHPPELY